MITWVKRKKHNLKKRLVVWLFKALSPLIREMVHKEGNRIESGIAALQAIDWHFKDSGKIIIIARIRNHDIIKVVPIRPLTGIHEVRDMVGQIQNQFCASPEFMDGPSWGEDNLKEFITP